MKVFLIAGKSGSGKDEVAKIIKKYYESINQKTVITKFSKYIRLFAMEMLNWDNNEKTKPRKFLQNMGQIMRKIKPRFLLDRMIDDLQIYQKYYSNVVISDVRLINEIEIFKEEVKDVITIYLSCDNKKSNLDEIEKKHITEIELDDYDNFDYKITNYYDKKLKEKIYEILKGLN